MCENANGDLIGMRSHITKYNAETMDPVVRLSMNQIGTVQGNGVTCSSIQIDVPNGEYLTSMFFAYENPGRIDYIRAATNKDQSLSMGAQTNDMTTGEMTSIQDTRILAFHGYENIRIAIGQVSVELSPSRASPLSIVLMSQS